MLFEGLHIIIGIQRKEEVAMPLYFIKKRSATIMKGNIPKELSIIGIMVIEIHANYSKSEMHQITTSTGLTGYHEKE